MHKHITCTLKHIIFTTTSTSANVCTDVKAHNGISIPLFIAMSGKFQRDPKTKFNENEKKKSQSDSLYNETKPHRLELSQAPQRGNKLMRLRLTGRLQHELASC